MWLIYVREICTEICSIRGICGPNFKASVHRCWRHRTSDECCWLIKCASEVPTLSILYTSNYCTCSWTFCTGLLADRCIGSGTCARAGRPAVISVATAHTKARWLITIKNFLYYVTVGLCMCIIIQLSVVSDASTNWVLCHSSISPLPTLQ